MPLGASVVSNDLGSSTVAKENYDIVKVDLDDGRDYPIYIGTGYSDEEGEFCSGFLGWLCSVDLLRENSPFLMISCFLVITDSCGSSAVPRSGKQGLNRDQ